MSVSPQAPFLGVDIGGTKVAVGIVDRDGRILAQGRKPMVTNGSAEVGLEAVTAAIDSMMSQGPVQASVSARRGRSIRRQA